MTSLSTYIRGRQRYRVTAPAALITLPGGAKTKMLYRGALVPVDSSPRQLNRLLQLEMIAPVETEAS